eukprot:2320244-Pleurochrysis_carterae.AAC.1
MAHRLLERDPKKRLGCGEFGVQEIKDQRYFAAIDWEASAPTKSDSQRSELDLSAEVTELEFARACTRGEARRALVRVHESS